MAVGAGSKFGFNPFHQRIFTFKSGMLRGLHQGYDHLAISPEWATNGRCFISFENDITGLQGFSQVNAVSGEANGVKADSDALVIAHGNNLAIGRL